MFILHISTVVYRDIAFSHTDNISYTHRHTTQAIFFTGDKRGNQLFFCLSEVT